MIEYRNMTAAQIADVMGFPSDCVKIYHDCNGRVFVNPGPGAMNYRVAKALRDCVKASGYWLVGKGLRRPALQKLKTLGD